MSELLRLLFTQLFRLVLFVCYLLCTAMSFFFCFFFVGFYVFLFFFWFFFFFFFCVFFFFFFMEALDFCSYERCGAFPFPVLDCGTLFFFPFFEGFLYNFVE